MRNRSSFALFVLTLSSAAFGQEVAAEASATSATPAPAAVGRHGDTFAAPNGQLGAGLSVSRTEVFRAYGELGFYTLGDSQSFGDAEISQRIWNFTLTLGGGYKISPELELEARLPFSFYDYTVSFEGNGVEESEGESDFGAGNLQLGANYVRAEGPLRMKFGGALQFGPWTIDPSDEFFFALVFASPTNGGQDLSLWAPETLSLVTPSRVEYDMQRVVFSGDGTLGIHVPTDGDGDVEASIQLAPGAGFYASPTVLVGARIPFAWYPTESGSNATYLAFEPYGRFDVSETGFLNARLTLNIDEPLGFSFDDGRIWSLHFGGGGTF